MFWLAAAALIVSSSPQVGSQSNHFTAVLASGKKIRLIAIGKRVGSHLEEWTPDGGPDSGEIVRRDKTWAIGLGSETHFYLGMDVVPGRDEVFFVFPGRVSRPALRLSKDFFFSSIVDLPRPHQADLKGLAGLGKYSQAGWVAWKGSAKVDLLPGFNLHAKIQKISTQEYRLTWRTANQILLRVIGGRPLRLVYDKFGDPAINVSATIRGPITPDSKIVIFVRALQRCEFKSVILNRS